MIILIEAVNTHEVFDDDKTNGSLECWKWLKKKIDIK